VNKHQYMWHLVGSFFSYEEVLLCSVLVASWLNYNLCFVCSIENLAWHDYVSV